jgi:hypothetical protein
MKMVQSSIALACLLAGADAFGVMPDSAPGPSHPCIMPGDSAAAAAAGFIETAEDKFCGKSSHEISDHDACEDDSMMALGFFGYDCDFLQCDGSQFGPGAAPTVAEILKGLCPLKCGGCDDFCNDKDMFVQSTGIFAGATTCAEAAEPAPIPPSVGAWNKTSTGEGEVACALVDGLPALNDITEGCGWYYDAPSMTNPTCEAVFRLGCPSMSGLCDSCPDGRRRLNVNSARAYMAALMTSGSFKMIA